MGTIESQARRAALPELLRPDDLALALGLSAGRVRDLLRDGTIPASRLRGRWIVRRRDLLEAVAPGRPSASTGTGCPDCARPAGQGGGRCGPCRRRLEARP